jgi:hypothetical protein
VVAHTFNPSIWEAEAGRSLSLRPAGLQSEFQDSQVYTEKPSGKNTKQNKTKQNKTKQNKTKQSKAKQSKAKQRKAKQSKTKQKKNGYSLTLTQYKVL